MTGTPAEAKLIYQNLLDIIGRAYLDSDIDSFLLCVGLPLDLKTLEGSVRFETEAEIRELFARFRDRMKEQQSSDLIRICTGADFDGPDQIAGRHVTRLIRHGTTMLDPYTVESRLQRVDGEWKVMGSVNQVRLSVWSIEEEKPTKTVLMTKPDNLKPGMGLPTSDTDDTTPIIPATVSESDVDAIRIYQSLLDTISAGVITGDIETVVDMLNVPLFMRTPDGLVAFNTKEDNMKMGLSFHASLIKQGATDYVRTATWARFMPDGQIEGHHTSRILSGNEIMLVPYENRMRLRLMDGAWRVVLAEHSTYDLNPNIEAFNVATGRLSELDENKKLDEIALSQYQAFLSALDASNMSHDYDTWHDLSPPPVVVILDTGRIVVDTEAQNRGFFDMVSTILKDNPGSTIQRTADVASFQNSHTLRGYHVCKFHNVTTAEIKPIRSRMLLALNGGKWHIAEVANALSNQHFPYKLPEVVDTLGSEFPIEEEDVQ